MMRVGEITETVSGLNRNARALSPKYAMAGAFGPMLGDPGVAGMIAAGAVPVLMKRLACMDLVRRSGLGFYGAALGAKGASGRPLDPTYAFMVRKWLRDLEGERAAQAGWLP